MPYKDKSSGKYRATKMIDGRRRTKLFKTKAEAKKWEAKQTETRWAEERRNSASPSLLEWSVRYLEFSAERHTEKTYRGEKVPAFNRLFEVVDPHRPVTKLTVADCLTMLKKQSRERSGHAANKVRKNLAAAWAWGTKYLGMPKENPFAAVDRFPSQQKARYVPPERDFWKVYDVACEDDKVLLLAFLHTGARRNELLTLKWEDVDLDNGKVRLWTRKRKGGSLEYDCIPLTRRLSAALADLGKRRGGEYVFGREDGAPWIARQRLVPRLCVKAGVPRFTYHSIRHLTASMLAQEGVDIPTIQAILRHKNSMTTTIYIRRLGITENALEQVFGK